MVCNGTSTERRGRAAFTLVELMVAIGLGLLVVTVMLALLVFAVRSFAELSNYADISLTTQMAMDKMTKEIRQAKQITACATNGVTLVDINGNTLKYTYDNAGQTLTRIGGGQTNVYLTACSSISFAIYQHTVMSNSFDAYSTAGLGNARVLQLTWHCSRKVMGNSTSTENTHSARVALRNH